VSVCMLIYVCIYIYIHAYVEHDILVTRTGAVRPSYKVALSSSSQQVGLITCIHFALTSC